MNSHLLYIAEFKWHLKIPGSSWLSEKILFEDCWVWDFMSSEKNTHLGISMGILRINWTGGDLKCKGQEKRKRWKKEWLKLEELNDRKSGAIKESCVRGGTILRDGFPAGERTEKNLSGTNSQLRCEEEVSH